MSGLSPTGTVRARFVAPEGATSEETLVAGEGAGAGGEDDLESAAYFGWEIARCAPSLTPAERRALGLLASATVTAMRAGSTRLPLDDVRLRAALSALGGADAMPALRSLLARARGGDPGDPVTHVLGRSAERRPLVVEGAWLYPERMRALEERFCDRVRALLARPPAERAGRPLGRAVSAVEGGPPALTEPQRRAVREALSAPLALITGGPGTGKTTIVVALLRALAWTGAPMESVAIAAPTGKAAQRLREAIAAGLASTPRDMAEAALASMAPVPQTLHRLLGWSPTTGQFARHENDRLSQRVVIVDEASMIDLALMDRLVRSLPADGRLVLLGDADQLPSVEAGAVFRDLCSGLRPVRLTTNLRVAGDPAARRIVTAAEAVNDGALDARFTDSVITRRRVEDLAFEGVEHLSAPWSEIGEALLERFWRGRVASFEGFAAIAGRTLHAPEGVFDEADAARLRALFAHFSRARILSATRTRGPTSAEAINRRLLARLSSGPSPGRQRRPTDLAPGAPIVAERNDYERHLFNGDQGIVVRADGGSDAGAELLGVFRREGDLVSMPLLETPGAAAIAPAFAMTVHKAQGSEFDDVILVLPEVDLPLLTRELVYTAMTRARRSVLLVGSIDLLARAVSRTIERHSGIAERLGSPGG